MTKSNWAERKQELQRNICTCPPIALQDNKHFLNCPNFELELLLQSEINKATQNGRNEILAKLGGKSAEIDALIKDQ